MQDDVSRLGGAEASLDAVTLWNVIEHVADGYSLLRACARLLKPGGIAYVICPNYAAWRQEAHYHVPWPPLLPRPLASRYLRTLGKDPTYFEQEIFYRTNWQVLRWLARLGLEAYDLTAMSPMTITTRRLWCDRKTLLDFYNPFRESVVLSARKRG